MAKIVLILRRHSLCFECKWRNNNSKQGKLIILRIDQTPSKVWIGQLESYIPQSSRGIQVNQKYESNEILYFYVKTSLQNPCSPCMVANALEAFEVANQEALPYQSGEQTPHKGGFLSNIAMEAWKLWQKVFLGINEITPTRECTISKIISKMKLVVLSLSTMTPSWDRKIKAPKLSAVFSNQELQDMFHDVKGA